MPLYSERKRLAEITHQESQGLSFWTEEFPKTFRTKVKHYILSTEYPKATCRRARKIILLDSGRNHLHDEQVDEHEDILEALTVGEDSLIPDIIEAFYRALQDTYHDHFKIFNEEHYESFIQTKLLQHRLLFDFINGKMQEKQTQELHVAVVEPALRLLSRRPGLDDVEEAYTAALEELHAGKPADSLTDAGRALQAMLSAMGCEGPTLGKQINKAKDEGILTGTESPLQEAILKSMNWASSMRNQKSDAHPGTGTANNEDGWLMVHIVGALILWLSNKAGQNDHSQHPGIS